MFFQQFYINFKSIRLLERDEDPEFQSRLQVMDIDEVDLQQLFEMIDTEGLPKCSYL